MTPRRQRSWFELHIWRTFAIDSCHGPPSVQLCSAASTSRSAQSWSNNTESRRLGVSIALSMLVLTRSKSTCLIHDPEWRTGRPVSHDSCTRVNSDIGQMCCQGQLLVSLVLPHLCRPLLETNGLHSDRLQGAPKLLALHHLQLIQIKGRRAASYVPSMMLALVK